MKADVKSSGSAASTAQSHQPDGLGSSSTQGRAAQEMQYVEGWSSGFYASNANGARCVVVAPDATGRELVSWATGQVKQLNILLELIGSTSGDTEWDPAEICGAIRHQLEQAEQVLIAANDRLTSEARRAA